MATDIDERVLKGKKLAAVSLVLKGKKLAAVSGALHHSTA
jgi:hypothetical protein